jgi:dTDP-4-dehydrorhamnose reductase
LADGTSVQAYSDLFLSAVSLRAAAAAILRIALGSVPGIFHISASDALSYFDVARFLASLEDAAPSLVQPSPSPQPNTPGSTILSCARTMETTSFRPSTSLENLRSAFTGLIP